LVTPSARYFFDALGIRGITDGMSAPELRHMLGEIRFMMLLDTKLLVPQSLSLSWNHNETAILQAGGDVSAGFAQVMKQAVVPGLDDLEQKLSSDGGTFLDVGVGSAGLAIAMAQTWPSLKIVGIDPWAPSLQLAGKNVQSAGLMDRIELRQQAIQDIADVGAFDLGWIPSPFISKEIIPSACSRVLRALRPGGWLLFTMVNPGNDPVTSSIVRLRTVLWGGCVMTQEEVEQLLLRTGFAEVRKLPAPPQAVIALVAARRAR